MVNNDDDDKMKNCSIASTLFFIHDFMLEKNNFILFDDNDAFNVESGKSL